MRAPAIIKAEEQIDVTQEAVIFELARLAFSDMRRVASWNEDGTGKIKASDQLDDDAARSIQEISIDKDGKVKLKLHSKPQALAKLGEFLGMSRDDMVLAVLAKLAGADPTQNQVMDPRETARRVALMLREGRMASLPG